MERKKNKVRVCFMKTLKLIITPLARFRKFSRKSKQRQFQIVIGIIALITFLLVTAIIYRIVTALLSKEKVYNFRNVVGTPMRRMDLRKIYMMMKKPVDHDYFFNRDNIQEMMLVNTPGCIIPDYGVNYHKYLKNTTAANTTQCGKRAVFLRKTGKDQVVARIKMPVLKQYANNMKITGCCYRFILDSVQYPHEKPYLKYSNCTKLKDNTSNFITLQTDFVNVQCSANSPNNKSSVIYDDVYAFCKKLNICTTYTKPCRRRYNALVIGMKSMSASRFIRTMTRTAWFMKNNNWLGMRGYTKIEDNSFSNIMAMLTGKNISKIRQRCADKMDKCNDILIWSAFKEIGYITAYGEDNVRSPNSFTGEYKLTAPPTDHYMRPFFLKEENKSANGSVLCAGKAQSGKQLLDYALDFANTYKKESFFGVFWLNSFSDNDSSHPEYNDKTLENFFNQLAYTGVLVNTFIFLLSDHGLRFGASRLQMEGFYDDRLPMNFMWVPLYFRGNHAYDVRALGQNQYRLTTPYDMYSTLLDIRKISMCINSTNPTPEACPNCHSLFDVVSENRTCTDVAIHEKWCTCHKLYPLPVQDSIGIKSVHNAVKHIQNKTKNIKTLNCWSCATVSLTKVHRIHFYYGRDRIALYYVVAFTLSPGNTTYEATILRTSMQTYKIIGPISVISAYTGLGKCALKRSDRLFCICQKKENC